MTEYDYSPAAVDRYMAKLLRVSDWVSDQHPEIYSNPFVKTPFHPARDLRPAQPPSGAPISPAAAAPSPATTDANSAKRFLKRSHTHNGHQNPRQQQRHYKSDHQLHRQPHQPHRDTTTSPSSSPNPRAPASRSQTHIVQYPHTVPPMPPLPHTPYPQQPADVPSHVYFQTPQLPTHIRSRSMPVVQAYYPYGHTPSPEPLQTTVTYVTSGPTTPLVQKLVSAMRRLSKLVSALPQRNRPRSPSSSSRTGGSSGNHTPDLQKQHPHQSHPAPAHTGGGGVGGSPQPRPHSRARSGHHRKGSREGWTLVDTLPVDGTGGAGGGKGPSSIPDAHDHLRTAARKRSGSRTSSQQHTSDAGGIPRTRRLHTR